MQGHSDDYNDLIAHKRFLDEIENGVRMVNREIIHERLPDVNRDKFLKFAIMVGRLRADYLEKAFELVQSGGNDISDELIADLKARREKFEEMVGAFEALQRAIERGYIDISKVVE